MNYETVPCDLNQTTIKYLKAISRLINSARCNRFQLLSLINKNVDFIKWPSVSTALWSNLILFAGRTIRSLF